MASRAPNEDDDQAGAALQTALAQQVGPLLGWDPVAAMAAMQRDLLHQQQQQQQNSASLSQSTAAALAAGLAAPQNPISAIPSLWPYGIPPVGLLGNPASSYLNHLQSLHNPLSFQQNLLLLEQIQQQRQLLAANPHLLMAAAAATSSSSPQPHQNNTLHQHNLLTTSNSSPQQQQQNLHLLQQRQQNLFPSINQNSTAPTNQHQDLLVDQHFRRSLGEDYNEIASGRTIDSAGDNEAMRRLNR